MTTKKILKNEYTVARSRIFIKSAIGVVILTTRVGISHIHISQFLQTIPHIINLELTIPLFPFE